MEQEQQTASTVRSLQTTSEEYAQSRQGIIGPLHVKSMKAQCVQRKHIQPCMPVYTPPQALPATV